MKEKANEIVAEEIDSDDATSYGLDVVEWNSLGKRSKYAFIHITTEMGTTRLKAEVDTGA